jgi:hypothetical protein
LIDSYNAVIAWSAENQKRCPYKIGTLPFCSLELYNKKVTDTLIAGSRVLVTEEEAYKGLQEHLEQWKATYALSTTNCITCGSQVQTADINMVEHVSAIYHPGCVTKFSEFSMVVDTIDYFKFLHPEGTSAAQDMVLIIHQGPLNMAASPLARHRGDTDTENLRRLLSCCYKLEVPLANVDLFLSVAGTHGVRSANPVRRAKKAATNAAKIAALEDPLSYESRAPSVAQVMQWKADEEAEYLESGYTEKEAQDQASIDDALNAALQAWGGVELEEDGECV